jgi:hypothetical protein
MRITKGPLRSEAGFFVGDWTTEKCPPAYFSATLPLDGFPKRSIERIKGADLCTLNDEGCKDRGKH